jgi:MFS family permease
MLVSDAVRAAMVLGLILVPSSGQLWLVYALGVLQSVVGTFFGPARTAMVKQVVPQEQLLQANSLAQTGTVISSVLGGTLAGALYGLTNQFWLAFGLDSLTFLISFGLVLAVRAVPFVSNLRFTSLGSVLIPLRDGLGLITKDRVLFALLLAFSVTMFGLGAVNVLFLPLIVNVLKVPTTWLGIIEAAQTAGMIVSGAVVAGLAARIRPARLVVLGLMALALLTASINLAGNALMVAVILFGFGLTIVPLQASSSALMQSRVPLEAMGRVGSSFSVSAQGANLVSMAMAGALGTVIGIGNVFLVSGGIVLLAAITAAWLLSGRSAQQPSHAA